MSRPSRHTRPLLWAPRIPIAVSAVSIVTSAIPIIAAICAAIVSISILVIQGFPYIAECLTGQGSAICAQGIAKRTPNCTAYCAPICASESSTEHASKGDVPPSVELIA